MSIPEQSGDSFDFCVLFRVYFIGKGAGAAAVFLAEPVSSFDFRLHQFKLLFSRQYF